MVGFKASLGVGDGEVADPIPMFADEAAEGGHVAGEHQVVEIAEFRTNQGLRETHVHLMKHHQTASPHVEHCFLPFQKLPLCYLLQE